MCVRAGRGAAATSAGAVFHKERDTLALRGAQLTLEQFAGGAEGGAAGKVDEDDVVAIEPRNDGWQVGNVDVVASAGAILVVGFDEGAFEQNDLAVADEVVVEEIAVGGVAAICDEWNLDGASDFDALFLQLDELWADEVLVFGDEFAARFDCRVAERVDDAAVVASTGMIDEEGADDEVTSQADVLVWVGGVDVGGWLVTIDVGPIAQQALNGVDEWCGDVHVPRLVVDELALGEVVGEPGGVIHVAVGEEDVVDAEDFALRAADIECEIEFGRDDVGFFAGE